MAAQHYVGIDVGEKRLFAVALTVDGASAQLMFSPSTEIPAVLWWALAMKVVGVAIDAPAAHSVGLATSGTRRIAEERLSIGGCYGTPPTGALLPGWMATGMHAHRHVSTELDTDLNLAGTGRVFEKLALVEFRDVSRVAGFPDRALFSVDDGQWLHVEGFLQDVLHAVEGVVAEVARAAAGVVRAVLRMSFKVDDHVLDDANLAEDVVAVECLGCRRGGLLADRKRALLPVGAVAMAMVAAHLGEVLLLRATLAFRLALVLRDAGVLEEHREARWLRAHLDVLAHQRPRHRVDRVVEGNVAVAVNVRLAPDDQLVPLLRRREQRGLLILNDDIDLPPTRRPVVAHLGDVVRPSLQVHADDGAVLVTARLEEVSLRAFYARLDPGFVFRRTI